MKADCYEVIVSFRNAATTYVSMRKWLCIGGHFGFKWPPPHTLLKSHPHRPRPRVVRGRVCGRNPLVTMGEDRRVVPVSIVIKSEVVLMYRKKWS